MITPIKLQQNVQIPLKQIKETKPKHSTQEEYDEKVSQVHQKVTDMKNALLHDKVKKPTGVVFPTAEELDYIKDQATLLSKYHKNVLDYKPETKKRVSNDVGFNASHYYAKPLADFIKNYLENIELPVTEFGGTILTEPFLRKFFNCYCSNNKIKIAHNNEHAVKLNDELINLFSVVHKGIRDPKKISMLPGKGYREKEVKDGKKKEKVKVDGIFYIHKTGEDDEIIVETFYFMQLISAFKLADYPILNFNEKQKEIFKKADEALNEFSGKDSSVKISKVSKVVTKDSIVPYTDVVILVKEKIQPHIADLASRFYPPKTKGKGHYAKDNYKGGSVPLDEIPSRKHFVSLSGAFTALLHQYERAHNSQLRESKGGPGPNVTGVYDEKLVKYLNLDRYFPDGVATSVAVTQLLAAHTYHRGLNQKKEGAKTIFTPDKELKSILDPYIVGAKTKKGVLITYDNLTLQKMQYFLHKLYRKVVFTENPNDDKLREAIENGSVDAVYGLDDEEVKKVFARIKEGEKKVTSITQEYKGIKEKTEDNKKDIDVYKAAYERGLKEFPTQKKWLSGYSEHVKKLEKEIQSSTSRKEELVKELF